MSTHPTVAMIGYSGHAYVCIETAQRMQLEIAGYHDVSPKEFDPYHLAYLGSEETFAAHGAALFISIGDNGLRQRIFEKLNTAAGSTFISLIHPQAIVSDSVEIKSCVLISAGAIVNALAKIETGAIINTGAIIEHECEISAFAHIAPGAVLAGNVKVGERTFVGANSVVKQGVTIGKDVIIGAGSVIIADIPDNVTVVGNPGKIIKTKI